MPIKNNQELYATVRELAASLDELGAAQLASELRGALAISSMPGEILGETRLVLQRVRDHEAYQLLAVRRRVDEGIDYVGRAFSE
jgi:hypothetical protein